MVCVAAVPSTCVAAAATHLQGDTLLHFMDAADAELRMPVAQVPLLQMQSLLGMGE